MNNIQINGFLLKVREKEEHKIAIDFVRVHTGVLKSRGRSRKEIQKDLDIVTAKSVYCYSRKTVADLEILLDKYMDFVHNY